MRAILPSAGLDDRSDAGRWVKRGFIYAPDGSSPWARHSALMPTPVLSGDKIRVYAGFRDDLGVSRIGFVDVDADNPAKILRVSARPVIDIGENGAFDDNGMNLGEIVDLNGDGKHLRMYYGGYQIPTKAKFLAFTGAAESVDGGETFRRVSRAPVMDRADEGIHFRVVHCVERRESGFQVWYSVGGGFRTGADKDYPRYWIKSMFSADGLSFDDEGEQCLAPESGEDRMGRLRVWREGGLFQGLFIVGRGDDGEYIAHRAHSRDGVAWQRDGLWLPPSTSTGDWDSKNICWPAPIQVGDRMFAFYSGNDMGKTGFGWAERLST